jgi:hypothetical protein
MSTVVFATIQVRRNILKFWPIHWIKLMNLWSWIAVPLHPADSHNLSQCAPKQEVSNK